MGFEVEPEVYFEISCLVVIRTSFFFRVMSPDLGQFNNDIRTLVLAYIYSYRAVPDPR